MNRRGEVNFYKRILILLHTTHFVSCDLVELNNLHYLSFIHVFISIIFLALQFIYIIIINI